MTSCLLPWIIQPFQERIYSLRKEFTHRGANSFLRELILKEMGGKNEIKELLPLIFTLMASLDDVVFEK